MTLGNTIILRRNINVEFPKQFVISSSSSDVTQFVRVYSGRSVTIKCPNHFLFDNKLLKCDINSVETNTWDYNEHCDENFEGVVPNPMNCRTFINCWKGIAHVQYCPINQLFSNSTERCTYQENANCCEYWEKDSSTLIYVNDVDRSNKIV